MYNRNNNNNVKTLKIIKKIIFALYFRKKSSLKKCKKIICV